MSHKPTAQTLRAQLMAPEPIQRVHALHALELELSDAPHAVAEELEAFAARGIPSHPPEEPAYREWVGKAVAYWERLHAPKAVPRMTSARARRVAA